MPKAAPPGFYGKVPDLGDFISRRLPPAFVTTWDSWLRLLLQSSRDRLGDAWTDAWLGAPIWHVGFGAGVAFPVQAWGVLIPSVDRVGRHFPFSIIGATDQAGLPLRDWAQQAEAQALAALDDGFSPDQLAEALTTLGPPAPVQPGNSPGHIDLPEDPGAWPELVAQTPGPAAGETLWWCRGAGPVLPHIRRLDGLPSGAEAAAMIAGH